MKKNVGSTDKIIRLLLAAVFIILFVFNVVSGVRGYIGLGLAFILIITSVVNFCPLYAIVGFSSVKTKKK